MPDESIHAIVTDPPYGLGFMGREWDDLPPGLPWARECLRVLKPGGHLLAFGGSRTWHRLAVAVEDAGFEIRDSIAWLYGSGFPKSLDVSKAIDKAAGAEREVVRPRTYTLSADGATYGSGINPSGKRSETSEITAPATPEAQQWDGWGTALKPAFEPIVVARKPLAGTVAANVLEHGTGALNIDGCRIGTASGLQRPERRGRGDTGGWADYTQEPGQYGTPDGSGRWPTNVILDDAQAAELDKQSGTSTSRRAERGAGKGETATYGVWGTTDDTTRGHDDEGGASRFFPIFRYVAKAPTSERPRVNGVAHPTVKPLDLVQWLVRLVTPPGGVVLDPFAGSGTTLEAALIEGFQCIGIEREDDYLPLIKARLTKPINAVLDLGDFV